MQSWIDKIASGFPDMTAINEMCIPTPQTKKLKSGEMHNLRTTQTNPPKYTSILHRAAEQGNPSLLRRTLESDKSMIDVADEEGNTALHVAAKKGYLEVCQVLLEVAKFVFFSCSYTF
jgi:hypothetical protein